MINTIAGSRGPSDFVRPRDDVGKRRGYLNRRDTTDSAQPSRAMKIQGEGVTAERSVLSVHEHLTERLQHSGFERIIFSTVA